jgi:broad specificity phosphatase PhoE
MPAPDPDQPIQPANGASPQIELIFYRHSLPRIDPSLPAREWHLSEEGKSRCWQLAGRLVDFHPSRILAEAIGIPYGTAEGLHEHLRSREAYTSQEDFEALVRAFFDQPDRLVFGDETADQAYFRFAQAIKAAREEYPNQSPLVIVSHGTVISLYVARAYSLDPFRIWKSLQLPCMVILTASEPYIIAPDDCTSVLE